MSRAHRLAAAATVVIPLTVVALMVWSAVSGYSLSGAGWKDPDNSVPTILVSLLAAVGWLGGTSILVAIFIGPTLLPRLLGRFAVSALLDSRAGFWPRGTADAPAPRLLEFASTWELFWAGLITLPACAILAPLLLGWLVFRPSVYGPAQAVAVGLLGIAVVGWSVWLVARIIATGPTAPTARG